MTAYVSLFRAINVGANQVAMPDLKALHESLGLHNVATYIRSGNVVFTSDETNPVQLAARIEEAFAARFGFRSQVMVRSAAELEEIIARNPFEGQPEKETKWLVVFFLAARPEPAALEALRKAYSGPEEFYLDGQELYIYYASGIGRSKLTNALLEKRLKVPGTGRNWNTVLQLRKMLQQ